jgi:hypothetical protein
VNADSTGIPATGGGRPVAEWVADTPVDEPLVFDEAQTYTGDPTPLTASRTYQWIHSLPRILCALTAAGLVLDFVHEHRWLPCSPDGWSGEDSVRVTSACRRIGKRWRQPSRIGNLTGQTRR